MIKVLPMNNKRYKMENYWLDEKGNTHKLLYVAENLRLTEIYDFLLRSGVDDFLVVESIGRLMVHRMPAAFGDDGRLLM